MRRSIDTSLDARRRQVAAYRAMTPATRLRLAEQMSIEVRSLAEAGSRDRATRARREDVNETRHTSDDR